MSRFRRIDAGPEAPAEVTLTVDGRPLLARAGDSLAAALLAAGHVGFARNARTGRPDAPWCLIGVCFSCLCEVDGRAGEQACLTPVRAGMQVRTALAGADGS
jgi:predicted molibdopterin-dependent oxidoreductase YjgC